MRIVLVGGGTGGHFYPLIAISEAIRDRDTAFSQKTELYYFGPKPYNQNSLVRLNIHYVYCPAGKRRRYFSILNYLDIFKIFFGTIIAIFKLYFLYPDLIMSKGGYTSVPVVIAAWFLRIPIVIHESDSTPGRANKFVAKKARYIAISYDDTAKYFPADKTSLTGIPVRKSFFVPDPNAYSRLGIDDSRPVIFVTGGSLGSERINNLILNSLDKLLKEYTIIHQVGKQNEEFISKTAGSLIQNVDLLKHYFIHGYMDLNLVVAAQQVSTLIISRAGSGTIGEIALAGKPSILIPIPEEVSHDQRSNAYAYARMGAATVLEEKNLSDSLLKLEIDKIIKNKNMYETMSRATETFAHKEAAYTIADTLLGIGNEHV